MNPVAILRQPWAATLALGLCMWAQIPHSQHVFEHWAKDQSGWAFAWGFEAAVLMFVVRNMHGASWTFASLSALINVGYYGLQSVDMWAWPNEGNWLNWLLSLALPFTIAMYSHVLADVREGAAWRLHLPQWAHHHVATLRSAWAKWRNQTDATQAVHNAEFTVALPVDVPLHPVQKCIFPDAQSAQDGNATDDALPIDARTEALQMHGEGMPPAEIARLLQQKESTVRSWIRRSNGATKERAA